MSVALASLSERLRSAPDLETFWGLINRELQNHDVASIFYAALPSRHGFDVHKATRSIFYKSNHPQQYFDAFGADAIVDDDLTAIQSYDSGQPFLWHDESNWTDATPTQMQRANIERDLGLEVGVTIPTPYFAADALGAIGLSTPGIKPKKFDAFWTRHGADILKICSVLDLGMRDRHMSEVILLTPQERECLTWIAVGLRPQQIAFKLSIAKKTVDAHLTSARRKLKSVTLENAVAKAILYNLILL